MDEWLVCAKELTVRNSDVTVSCRCNTTVFQNNRGSNKSLSNPRPEIMAIFKIELFGSCAADHSYSLTTYERSAQNKLKDAKSRDPD